MITLKTLNGRNVTLSLAGRLDTVTSVDLLKEIDKIFSEGEFNITLDFKEVDYISSAGVRVVLDTQKQAKARGTTCEIIGTTENVKKVFDITGVSEMLNIR